MSNTANSRQKPLESDSVASIEASLKKLGIANAEGPASSPDYDLIDTAAAVGDMVDALQDLPTRPPSLYVDLEGDNLCRLGTISILQIHVSTTGRTYLVDIRTLRELAFSTPGATHTSSTLKAVLEDAKVPKVFFDVRADSDAIFAHYAIKLKGIEDLQLMELATSRSMFRKTVSGLARCIEYDANLTLQERTKFNATKELGKKLFLPEYGGSYAVFDQRPLSKVIAEYCVQDANVLPKLWRHYNGKMTPAWRGRMLDMSRRRVTESQSPHFKGKGQHMALAPSEWNGIRRT